MRSFDLLRERLNIARWATVFLLILTSQLPAAQQQVSPAITVTVNKSTVFRLAERAKRVSVSQPQVADVIVVAPSQLLINGKAVGTTSLIIFDEKGEVANYDLIVAPDVAALRGQLRVVLPNEKVEIATSGPFIVLKGEVSNEVIYDKVLEIAQTYLPPKPPAPVAPSSTTSNSINFGGVGNRPHITGTAFAGGGQLAFDEEASLSQVDRWGDKRRIEGIIDLLVISEVRQIELDVIVAEVAMSKLREIGFDWLLQTRNTSFNTFLGDQSGFPTPLLGPGNAVSAAGPLVFGNATSGIFRYSNGAFALTSLYRLLQNKDITEILAQPRLVMKNGRSGGFLAGGEFPVVVSNQTTFAVEFRPFGVRLDFVPTLTWSDRIDLRVFPEVSDIDQSVAVNGVPGLKVRRTVNRVEMRDGESLVIGGLLDRRILKDLTKFPLLGDVPVLGALFRSTRFRNQESELIFVITPRIVSAMKPGEKPRLPSIEKYDDPDIRQVPVPGNAEEKKPAARAATIP
ncbi:MAG TPA: pilus assembly protein N-terminal domain-containing protein [Candidatus Udaeobacter sp.]|nr:pilus assembly protein N-terminal domain-containing protein [Candidatus Udaeobacter sp.]